MKKQLKKFQTYVNFEDFRLKGEVIEAENLEEAQKIVDMLNPKEWVAGHNMITLGEEL